MEKYNRYCPVAKAADILCEKWVILILREFMMGSTRFAQLRRGLPKISPSVLSRRLKEIEMQGVITRIKRSDNSFEYRLTEAGEEIRPIVLSFGAWGYKWVKNKINKEDLDAGHLLWDMRHCINIEYFENQRVVVHMELSDQRNTDRYWWMLIDSNGVDLCFEDIGQDPDIIVVTTLSTLKDVWQGHVPLDATMRSRKLKILGSSQHIKNISHWFECSALSKSKIP